MNIWVRVSLGMWCINCLSDLKMIILGFFCKYILRYIIYLENKIELNKDFNLKFFVLWVYFDFVLIIILCEWIVLIWLFIMFIILS